LPLAIELAAARVKVLGAQQLLARLAGRLDTLGQGPRDAPARQRTLRATIDWSYNLLNEEEKGLLGQASVFQGGWTLEAMEAICTVALHNLSHIDPFDTLSGLIDKSLVQATDDFNNKLNGESRFKQLETVREYALEHLQPHEAEALHRRHRDFFLQLAERGEKGLETAEAQRWYERLHIEEDNFYAALDWCQRQPGEAAAGLTLAGALWHYWHVRGIVWEGRRWLTLFLERTEARKSFERARALNGAGMLAYRQGEYQEVTRLCGEALAISESLQESHREDGIAAFALHYLAHVAQEQGKMVEAEEMLSRSMALYSGLGNEWGYAETLNCLGDLHRQLGSYGEAAQMLEEALRVRRKLKDQRGIGTTLHNLGHVLCRQNDPAAAAASFRESLEISLALNNKPKRIMCVLGFAQVAAIEGKAEQSVLLLSAASHLLEVVGYRLEPPERGDYEWLVAHLHTLLDEKSYQAIWKEGSSMSLTQAVAVL
jgi:tetratricopeptide (TPR) repeat protein